MIIAVLCLVSLSEEAATLMLLLSDADDVMMMIDVFHLTHSITHSVALTEVHGELCLS